MRVPVKCAAGRRPAVPVSAPTYELDLTYEEMCEIRKALHARIHHFGEDVDFNACYRDSVSALAVIQWRLNGRR